MMEQQVNGASADADRAVVNGAASVSALRASVPSAGDWIIVRGWSLQYREVMRVTPKLLKLGGGSTRYPTQIARDARGIVCVAPDRETAMTLVNSIAGADGECRRRCDAARSDYDTRCKQANDARDKAVERLVAQAIKARRAETGTGSVHESAVAESDAP